MLAVTFTIYMKIININCIANFKDIITSIINFIAILSGFLTTMLSILITSSDKSIFKYLRKKKRINEVFYYISSPIIWGFLNILFCLLLITYSDSQNLSSLVLFYVVIFLTIFFILTSIRAIVILVLIIKNMNDEAAEEEENSDTDREVDLEKAFKQNNR